MTTFRGFCIRLTAEVIPKIFPNLSVVTHLVVPAGWGPCLPRLAIFMQMTPNYMFIYLTRMLLLLSPS